MRRTEALQGARMIKFRSVYRTFTSVIMSSNRSIVIHVNGRALVVPPQACCHGLALSRKIERVAQFHRQPPATCSMIDLGGDTTGNGISKLVFTTLSAVAERRVRPHVQADHRGEARPGRHAAIRMAHRQVGRVGADV